MNVEWLSWIRYSLSLLLLLESLGRVKPCSEFCSDFIPCILADNRDTQCENAQQLPPHEVIQDQQKKTFRTHSTPNSTPHPWGPFQLRWPVYDADNYNIDFITISERNGTYSVEVRRILQNVLASGVLVLPDWFWHSMADLACIQGVFRITETETDRSPDTFGFVEDLKSLIQHLQRCPQTVRVVGSAGRSDGRAQININLSVSKTREDQDSIPDATMHLDVRTREGPLIFHLEGSGERVNIKLNALTAKTPIHLSVHPEGTLEDEMVEQDNADIDEDCGPDEAESCRYKRSFKQDIFNDPDDDDSPEQDLGEVSQLWSRWFAKPAEEAPQSPEEILSQFHRSRWARWRWIPKWLKSGTSDHEALLDVKELLRNTEESKTARGTRKVYTSANGGALQVASPSFQRPNQEIDAGSFIQWAVGWIKTLRQAARPPKPRRYVKQKRKKEVATESYLYSAYKLFLATFQEPEVQQSSVKVPEDGTAESAEILDGSTSWFSWLTSAFPPTETERKEVLINEEALQEEIQILDDEFTLETDELLENEDGEDVVIEDHTPRTPAITAESDKKTWVYRVMMAVRHAYDFVLQTARSWKGSVMAAWRGFAKDQCVAWYRQELVNPPAFHEVPQPPCNLKAALEDPRFLPDTACHSGRGYCPFFHNGAYHCIRSRQPSVSGHGQQACYDDKGRLLNFTSGGGTFDRSHPDGVLEVDWSSFVPSVRRLVIWRLSHIIDDVWPFLTCCKFTEHCNFYGKVRPTWTSCANYSAAAHGS